MHQKFRSNEELLSHKRYQKVCRLMASLDEISFPTLVFSAGARINLSLIYLSSKLSCHWHLPLLVDAVKELPRIFGLTSTTGAGPSSDNAQDALQQLICEWSR
eukprot:2368188-Amphidinium_carterae.1